MILRKGMWIAAGALATLVVAGIAVYSLSNRSGAPQPPAATTPPAETAAPEATAATGAPETPAAATATPPAGTEPDALALYSDDKILGSAEAPITVIEYASLTCPHCASFDTDTFPKVKENYIDKGLVRFVYRDFPLDGAALRAALLARCVPDERYFNMLQVLFRSQAEWGGSPDPIKALGQIGRTAGLSQEKVDACLGNQAELDKILLRRQEAESKYQVDSTPTFVINGEKHAGALPYEEFDTILKGKLP